MRAAEILAAALVALALAPLAYTLPAYWLAFTDEQMRFINATWSSQNQYIIYDKYGRAWVVGGGQRPPIVSAQAPASIRIAFYFIWYNALTPVEDILAIEFSLSNTTRWAWGTSTYIYGYPPKVIWYYNATYNETRILTSTIRGTAFPGGYPVEWFRRWAYGTLSREIPLNFDFNVTITGGSVRVWASVAPSKQWMDDYNEWVYGNFINGGGWGLRIVVLVLDEAGNFITAVSGGVEYYTCPKYTTAVSIAENVNDNKVVCIWSGTSWNNFTNDPNMNVVPVSISVVVNYTVSLADNVCIGDACAPPPGGGGGWEDVPPELAPYTPDEPANSTCIVSYIDGQRTLLALSGQFGGTEGTDVDWIVAKNPFAPWPAGLDLRNYSRVVFGYGWYNTTPTCDLGIGTRGAVMDLGEYMFTYDWAGWEAFWHAETLPSAGQYYFAFFVALEYDNNGTRVQHVEVYWANATINSGGGGGSGPFSKIANAVKQAFFAFFNYIMSLVPDDLERMMRATYNALAGVSGVLAETIKTLAGSTWIATLALLAIYTLPAAVIASLITNPYAALDALERILRLLLKFFQIIRSLLPI